MVVLNQTVNMAWGVRSSSLGQRATFRAVLQSLRSARTGTTQPATRRRCARRAMTIECPPWSANTSSHLSSLSNTSRQIASTSAAGSTSDSELGGSVCASSSSGREDGEPPELSFLRCPASGRRRDRSGRLSRSSFPDTGLICHFFLVCPE